MRELKNVLSLFDGHSGMQISLVDSGIEFENYYASEIDKHAIKVTQHNFPNTIQLGSVVDIDVSKLPKIDIISAGSPCQSFSFAGKRKGMSTTCNEEITTLEKYLQLKSENFEFEGQSYLFWEFMRILTEARKINPDVLFLLENVEMGKKWESVLSHALGIFGVHINSTLVSAQNRKRIYWTNIQTRHEGLFGDLYTDIPQPEDREIFLKDVLESSVDEKYYLSDKSILGFKKQFKKHKLKGNGFKFEPTYADKKSNAVTTKCGSCITDDFIIESNKNYIKIDKQGNPKVNQEKASCFTAGGNSGGNHSDMDLFIVAQRGRNPDNPKSRVSGLPTEQMLEPRKDGKTNCLTSVQKDNLLMQIGYVGNGNSQANRVYDVNGKSVCLQGEAGGGGGKTGLYLEENEPEYRIRRLTPEECKRLQTVPEWVDLKVVSDTQQYRMLGNGWTIEVIKHILNYGNFKKRH